MVNTQVYPSGLIYSLKAKKITRQQFIYLMRAWQIAHGINYSCKGTADKNAVWVIYMGVPGMLDHGRILWLEDGQQRTADSFFEFKRQVNYMKNRQWWNIRRTIERAKTAGGRG